MTKTRRVNVKAVSTWRLGKHITRKAHTRIIKDTRENVKKSEYKEKFKKRPKTDQARDLKRRSKNAVTGNKNLLSASWDTKKYDWIGIDARGYHGIKKESIMGTITKSVPDGYKIIKYHIINKNGRMSVYRPMYKNKQIGTISPYRSLKAAKTFCSDHYKRSTKQVFRVDREAEFMKKKHNTRVYDINAETGRAWHSDVDSAYSDETETDTSLYHTEKLKDKKYKRSMRGFDVYGRGR